MKQAWSLEDVEEAARANPRSFFIPSLSERTSQPVGSAVRLHFLLVAPGPKDPRAERMWVDIVAAEGSPPRYRGRLDNPPLYIPGLELGAIVEFGPEHIAQTVIKLTDAAWFETAELGALVSAKVFEPGECVRWMYREAADHPQDSGWRLFAGSESDEEANDVSRIRTCNVGWLIDFDPTLTEPLRAAFGKAFERTECGAQWQVLESPTPPIG